VRARRIERPVQLELEGAELEPLVQAAPQPLDARQHARLAARRRRRIDPADEVAADVGAPSPVGAAPDRRGPQRAAPREGESAAREPRSLGRRHEVGNDRGGALAEGRRDPIRDGVGARYAKIPG
jgi:hypothetical protein